LAMKTICPLKKVFTTLIISAMIILMLIPSSYATNTPSTIELWIGNSNMLIEGVSQPIDSQGTKPIISDNRTLLPIRAVIEAFGGTASWSNTSRQVTITMGDDTLKLWIDNPQAELNGSPLAIDPENTNVVPVTINGRTMVPLRFVAESLGAKVQYEDATQKITLIYKPWNIYTMDSVGDVGSNTSIAVDSNNQAHISYIDTTNGKLKYMTILDGQWKSSWIIGSASDQCTAIAVDSNGKCHMAYNGPNGELNYATNATSDSGLIHTIETGVWAGLFGDEDIAVDGNGNPHIVYFNGPNFDLKYATNASGNWETSVIVNGSVSGELPAYSASIGVDSNDKVHICYYDDAAPDSIKYITNISGVWTQDTVDTIGSAAGWSTGLSVDSEDKIHIIYYDWGDDALKYATNASGTWQSETVNNNSGNVFSASLAVDQTNQPYIVYSSDSGFMYAKKAADTWQISEIDEAWTGAYNSVAIGINSIHTSYKDTPNGNLKYAWKPLY